MSEDSDDKMLHMPKPEEVLECIEEWRYLDLKKESDYEIDKKLNPILKKILEKFVVNYKFIVIEYLYRIRRFKDLFGDVSGCWAPPAENARLGRCNGEKDSVLYTSSDRETPFEELEIEHNCQVYMIKYKVIEKEGLWLVNLVPPYYKGSSGETSIFNTEGAISYNILREFIRSEFTKPVGKGTEYLYKISSSICRIQIRDEYDEDVDGWIYPSVHTRVYGNNNIALKAESARKKLKIDSIVIGRLQREDNYIQIEFKGEIKEDKITWIPHEDKEFLNNL